MDWEKLFEASSSKMKLRLAEIRAALNHRGLKGCANEAILSEWLEQYLPRNISVCTGEIIDSDGNRSRQSDVIVFDTATAPRFLTSGDTNVLPIECVYSVFEVKTYLNKSEIEAAFANMCSLKELKKIAYFPTTVTTTKSLYGKISERWPVNFFLFAFESDGLDTILTHVKDLNSKQPLDKRIDMVCVLDKGLIVNTGPDGLQPIPMPNTQLIAKPSSKALLTFYALISGLLAQATSEPVCVHPYLKHIQH